MRTLVNAPSRALIEAEIRAALFPGHDPARWAVPLVEQLDRTGAAWRLVELEEAEFGALWLPGHRGEACHGDVALLGPHDTGGTVRDLAGWLDAHGDRYAERNPSCWSRIRHAGASPAGALVVSNASVGDRVKPASAALVVVDGLHRALAYWQRGDRMCRAWLSETDPEHG